MNPAIKTEIVHHENLVLCCTKEYFQMVKQQKRATIF